MSDFHIKETRSQRHERWVINILIVICLCGGAYECSDADADDNNGIQTASHANASNSLVIQAPAAPPVPTERLGRGECAHVFRVPIQGDPGQTKLVTIISCEPKD
jgi:hypothetical protein